MEEGSGADVGARGEVEMEVGAIIMVVLVEMVEEVNVELMEVHRLDVAMEKPTGNTGGDKRVVVIVLVVRKQR